MEIDRSLLLEDRPAMDPKTGALLPGVPPTLADGSPAILHIRSHLTMHARMSQHGLPLIICLYLTSPEANSPAALPVSSET